MQVLHMDRNNYYGGESASLSLKQVGQCGARLLTVSQQRPSFEKNAHAWLHSTSCSHELPCISSAMQFVTTSAAVGEVSPWSGATSIAWPQPRLQCGPSAQGVYNEGLCSSLCCCMLKQCYGHNIVTYDMLHSAGREQQR